MQEVARGLPSPLGNQSDVEAVKGPRSTTTPTTLNTLVTVIPEVKILDKDGEQEFWVSVEIEGALHNRRELLDSSLDVVFIVDNGYYVSKDCLSHALDTTVGALRQLSPGDRVALYATHCTHGPVASTVPDRLLPLRSVSQHTEDLIRDLASDIATHGTQGWSPPRPTPPTASVILAIAKSLENEAPKYGRCHMILLSPIFDVLHAVSETFPDLHVHQINPAILPYIPYDGHRKTVCSETCCKNVFVKNWTHYQSVPDCIKQIILQARSYPPIGNITNVHVGFLPKDGCEVVYTEGPTKMRTLRAGQTFSFLARVRVCPSKTEELSTTSEDPILDHCLHATKLQQELHIAGIFHAKLTHLLSFQIFHKNALNRWDAWSYTEAPLVVVKKLGRLAQPFDFSLEVYKRLFFQMLSKADHATAMEEVEKLAKAAADERSDIRQLVRRMAKEVQWHDAVLHYQATARQKLPMCIGPIDIASSENHEHIQKLLDANLDKRKGRAVM
ncbi:hypothetical protein BU23DRAFT_500416 [Bimuria novae-zelandiae CBS 107.79]|uniref:Uncharacterized protein n=1 Tax=Bimuria novae-zelandiae CBS 107.79 TaxID=1447943 RepID=A0A6A5VLU5_9PLEO|nr:hypothetical protein BU23DRAFT_500416 [Bimuria novae-zelandiae CBS 107.79]